ncbi:MAG: D-alanine--D-alanine ligase [Deltaproteobacteria bacterium]|nr:D-alanine--D-alanine ligase [Deltaproteobacteria bacterium]MBW2595065.1 D-alanine--D-alanine ligase [Deltaproteobacteria bacterium]MBW2650846.1 D-alanine--D-alanine ligase [Deltaproteobacteria bacterium]
MKLLRVGIILGGMSSEKEVSLNSGRNVYDNLDGEKYEGIPIFMDSEGRLWIIPWQLVSQNTTTDISEHLEKDARRISYEQLKDEIDFAFISLHGKYGDDGCIQGLLEILGIPYTGPGVLASALGMDKSAQQKILKAAGINVPESVVFSEDEWSRDKERVRKKIAKAFDIPFVVKPVREGSSMGVTIVRNEEMLEGAMAGAFKWDRDALVEEYLEGTEFSCIVLEGEDGPGILGVTEIHPHSDFYSYDDKYMPGRCSKFTPPKNIPADAVDRIKTDVIKAFETLGFRSYGRIDGFVLEDGRVLITDPNSSSGMAPSSFFFEQAAEAGMLPFMIISELIEASVRVHEEKRGPL